MSIQNKKNVQNHLPDWVILCDNDNSRAVLLDWFYMGMRIRTDENSLIWIRYGVKPNIIREDSQFVIETPAILPRTMLCIPQTDDPGISPDVSIRTRFAVLEEFPFRKESSIDLIRKLKDRERDVMVVLMDLPRHQAASDINLPGEDLRLALQDYQADGCHVMTLQNADGLRNLLHWRQSTYDKWTNKARNYLIKMQDRIEEIPFDYPYLEEDWADNGGILQIERMNRIFSYETAKREAGETLWDRYAVASRKALFPNSGQGPLNSVARLYKECLENPLVFWSVEEDIRDFMETLRGKYGTVLKEQEKDGRYRSKTKLPTHLDEDGYLRVAARNGDNGMALNAIFRKIMNDFLCEDVKEQLQSRLRKRYQQLEGMIL